MTVTKARLDALEQMRPTCNAELHLRPDAPTVAYVRSTVEAERQAELSRGYRSLNTQSFKLNRELIKLRAGQARAQFNQNCIRG